MLTVARTMRQPSGVAEVREGVGRRSSSSDDGAVSFPQGVVGLIDPHTSTSRKDEIARAETKALFSMRIILLIIVLVSTIGVSMAVYVLTHNAEEALFEETFQGDAAKVLQAIGTTFGHSLGAADAFVVNMVVLANSSWPLFTPPSFAITASKLRSQTKSFAVGYYPLVTAERRDDWEAYSLANDAWVDEAIDIQSRDDSFRGRPPENVTWRGYGKIFTNQGPPVDGGPYLPTWNTAPVIVTDNPPYNWDLYHSSSPINTRAIDQLFLSANVVLSEINNLADPNDPQGIEDDEGHTRWASSFISEDEDPTEPFITIYYPIIDLLTDVTIKEPESKPLLVGVLAMSIFWRELMKEVLQTSPYGILIVVGNSCGQAMTYEVNGPSVVYVGRGDLHNSAYDDKFVESKLSKLYTFSFRYKLSYTGLPLSEDFCPYWVRVHPSNEMRDIITSKNPGILTATAVLVFIFTSAVFIAYDVLVERRQRKVMKCAAQTSEIVSSLFPSTVQDRLMKRRTESGAGTWRSPDNTIVNDGSSGRQRSSEPIADLFSDTTVMFADVVGFTHWSSSRSPVEVFLLLESIYDIFDEVTNELGVFKVETIGDSYMAATGLPTPRFDHAIVLTRFAIQCREQTRSMFTELGDSLGPETGDLRLRFGLHSGSVTGGVLRGDKSRFQLFGDTVNTASRMESTGKPDRIQVSPTTADLLRDMGKGGWISAREDMIEVKGKGLMQTYWVECRNDTSPSPCSTNTKNR